MLASDADRRVAPSRPFGREMERLECGAQLIRRRAAGSAVWVGVGSNREHAELLVRPTIADGLQMFRRSPEHVDVSLCSSRLLVHLMHARLSSSKRRHPRRATTTDGDLDQRTPSDGENGAAPLAGIRSSTHRAKRMQWRSLGGNARVEGFTSLHFVNSSRSRSR